MIVPTSSRHLTDTLLMVRPYDFAYNDETGTDNEFQQSDFRGSPEEITAMALVEFDTMVRVLRDAGVYVLIPQQSTDGKKTPDAVFPNNWISTEHDGTVILYPMAATNRRSEKRIQDIEQLLIDNRFYIKNILNIGRMNETEYFLEGTGSMVLDHNARVVYAAQSKRCHPAQLDNFVRIRRYARGILFDTLSTHNKPIYHTNVMMSVGDQFAVICSACIPSMHEREEVLEQLRITHTLIDISYEQMEKHFCGNILHIKNTSGEPLIVMSENAYNGFTQAQRAILSEHGKILKTSLTTLETIGGGSARCMMAEIFLPKIIPA